MEGFNHEMVEPEGTCRCILAQFPHSGGGVVGRNKPYHVLNSLDLEIEMQI